MMHGIRCILFFSYFQFLVENVLSKQQMKLFTNNSGENLLENLTSLQMSMDFVAKYQTVASIVLLTFRADSTESNTCVNAASVNLLKLIWVFIC